MSQASPIKTQAEFDEQAILSYEREHEGPFQMEELARHLIKGGWKVRTPSPTTILTRRLKKRARELREVDPQNRKVRSMHANKIKKIGPDNEPMTEVVWAHINSMDWYHALAAFQQRHSNYQKQDRALTRDMGSFNDNNPAAAEHKIQKEMFFTYDEPNEQVVETIKAATGKKAKPR